MGQALKIPDLHSEDVQKLSDAELTQIITKGKNKMPAYETKLSKEQISQLVGFVRSWQRSTESARKGAGVQGYFSYSYGNRRLSTDSACKAPPRRGIARWGSARFRRFFLISSAEIFGAACCT